MPSDAQFFLESAFAGKPENLFLRLSIPSWNASCWVSDVDDAAECAESRAAQDVYVSLGLGSREYGDTEICTPEEFAALVGVSIDIALRSDAQPQAPRPRTVEDALSILPKDLPPTFVVQTGDGVQACWLFQDPYVFENDEDRKQAASLGERWNALVRDNGRMRGWPIERAVDLAYLVRVPGTTNCEDPANPKPVTFRPRSDRRYSPFELIDYLDDQEVPDPKAAAEFQHWAGQDRPLAINLSAQITDEDLHRLEADTSFKNTWFRLRSDLCDQSQEEYDLSLASTGIRGGLSYQQIIDLIIHHRRMHKQKQRTRLDYYKRVLAKAASSSTGTGQFLPCIDVRVPGMPGNATDNGPDQRSSKPNQGGPRTTISDREKIALCDRISAALGVEVIRMVKLSGKDPLYRMELPEGKVEFQNVGKLICYNAVREAIAARANKLIPGINRAQWPQIAQWMLDACIVEDGGEELEDEGAARAYLTRYLVESTLIPALVGQSPQDWHKPMVRAGRITVSASDLQMFINRVTVQNLSVRAVAALLSAIGGKQVRVRDNTVRVGNKIREQGRWELPLEEFDPADYSSNSNA